MITNNSVSVSTEWLTVLPHLEDIDWKLLTLVLFSNGRASKDSLRQYFKTEVAFISTLERLMYYEILMVAGDFVFIPANVKPNFHTDKPKPVLKKDKVDVSGADAKDWQTFVPWHSKMNNDVRRMTWDIFTFAGLDKSKAHLYIIDVNDWIKTCRQLIQIVGGDVTVVQKACRILKEKGYTITGPRSLLKTCAAIKRGDKFDSSDSIEI